MLYVCLYLNLAKNMQAFVARQCYFNYTTRDRSQPEMLKMITPQPNEHYVQPFVE